MTKILGQIKQLSKIAINRIAAGEVVERPSSVVKELVENSIDAKSSQIDIDIQNGGRNLIRISDNGIGMNEGDLTLATERHTTSKLNEDDILNIQFFGFRGEALPSIASVSRMKIVSRKQGSQDAWQIEIESGEKGQPIPSSRTEGTMIEVRDLFCATPARLKFLKTEKTENNQIIEIVNRIAMAHPEVGFKLTIDDKIILNSSAKTNPETGRKERIAEIMKDDFLNNSEKVSFRDGDIKISGYVSLPTHNRGTSSEQYLYVNSRPVKDKILISAIKASYQDYLARDRHPYVVLFLDMPPFDVDVNVHPAKTEVRFRNSSLIRGLMIKSIKEALQKSSFRTSSEISAKAMQNFRPETVTQSRASSNFFNSSASIAEPQFSMRDRAESGSSSIATMQRPEKLTFKQTEQMKTAAEIFNRPAEPEINHTNEEETLKTKELGEVKCQLYDTYIISQTENSIIITDQHAAHERLVYEQLKNKLAENAIENQRLLIPETIELNNEAFEKIMNVQAELAKTGLVFEKCGINSILVSEIPALIGDSNIKSLIMDICDDLIEYEESLSFNELLEHILGTFSCHRSLRAGRKLSLEEMNELLRTMEKTAFSGQCNHGRPTYVELDLDKLEILFGRK